jgi:hypothetical protein
MATSLHWRKTSYDVKLLRRMPYRGRAATWRPPGGHLAVATPTSRGHECDQWLNRLQNQDRRFMLSFTTVGVGLRKVTQRSVSVYANLLRASPTPKMGENRWFSVKNKGNPSVIDVSFGGQVPVSVLVCRCRRQVSTVGLGSDRKPRVQSRFRI